MINPQFVPKKEKIKKILFLNFFVEKFVFLYYILTVPFRRDQKQYR
jgi:hypothetical protein